MVFRSGYCDPNSRDVAKLSKSIKKKPKKKTVIGECFFFSFLKVEQNPKCLDTSILHGIPFLNLDQFFFIKDRLS